MWIEVREKIDFLNYSYLIAILDRFPRLNPIGCVSYEYDTFHLCFSDHHGAFNPFKTFKSGLCVMWCNGIVQQSTSIIFIRFSWTIFRKLKRASRYQISVMIARNDQISLKRVGKGDEKAMNKSQTDFIQNRVWKKIRNLSQQSLSFLILLSST